MLFRYQEISAQSNVRYLDALSQVQDPTSAVRDLAALTTNASTKDGRTVRAFNLLSRNERLLFDVLLAGEHARHGFTNRDVRQHLARTPYPLASQAKSSLVKSHASFGAFTHTGSSPKSRTLVIGASPFLAAEP